MAILNDQVRRFILLERKRKSIYVCFETPVICSPGWPLILALASASSAGITDMLQNSHLDLCSFGSLLNSEPLKVILSMSSPSPNPRLIKLFLISKTNPC